MSFGDLPNLPGYRVSGPIVPGEKGFGKRQTLRYLNGFAIEEPLKTGDDFSVDSSAAVIARSVVESSPRWCNETKVTLPKWVEMDRQVLRFYGYFTEAVVESPIEDHRVRKVTIYYYLADDTTHIEEPKQDNSGLTQGILVKRHKVRKRDGRDLAFYDLKLGDTITIYGRSITIVSCDQFTREYLKSASGYDAPAAVPYPIDPIDTYRASKKNLDAKIPPNPRTDSLTRYIEAKLGKPSNVLEKDTLKQYLENNRKVLRFWCFWDDRSSLFGQRRPFVLHYFLEDDTGEILECFETNSGRDPFPVFQKRGPLFKGQCGFFRLEGSPSDRKIYEPIDLRIGSTIVQNNRSFFIYDCDDYTRQWYKSTLGTSDEELRAIYVTEKEKEPNRPSLPPYNGFGSLEDTKQNCVQLIPKPPKKDFLRLMNKDSIVLRFSAKLCPLNRFKPSVEDGNRNFIVTYFMSDDSIAIFERTSKNAGLVGGKFLERGRILKPGSEDCYSFQDLYVGAIVDFHRHGFRLLDADEYTYTYMENNKHIFHLADPEATLIQLAQQSKGREKEIRASFFEASEDGRMSTANLGTKISSAEFKLAEHQVQSLIRKYNKESSGTVDIEAFLSSLKI